MKRVIKGLNINYQVIGEGRPLLILHGWGSKSDNWQEVGEMLTEKGINPVRKNQKSNNKTFYSNYSGKVGLSNGVKVIIPDLPGFGQSDKPPKAWGLDDYCDFVEEFVENLNLERFYLLGHSFGGALAAKCSLKFPEKIDKLFLVGAACFRRRALRKKIFYIIAKILKIFSFFPFYPSLREGFYKFIVRKSDYPYAEGVMKETYLKIIKEDLSDTIPQIRVPTIIIWGEKDKIKRIKEAYLIKEKIENSKLKVLPELGHDLNREAPEKLAEAITQYL